MKLVSLVLLSTLTATVNSDVFSYSTGWKPGQTMTSQGSIPTVSPRPASETPSGGQLSWSSLLTSGPLGNLLGRSGINITEKLGEAQKAAALPWDDRIPMIRDDNYKELIINELFATPEEEESRLWFLVVTVTSSQRMGMSPVIDEQFNEAYNTTLIEQDLPDVRWGRIDYLNVTRLTTKWGVWRAPLLIVAKNRGKTLRFFHPQEVGARASQLRTFLLNEIWRQRDPWSGPWAPGGSREVLLDKFAIIQDHIYFYLTKVPRWVLFLLSGTIGSVLVQVLHAKPKPKPSSEKTPAIPVVPPKPEQEQETNPVEVTPTLVDSKKPGMQKRKGSRR